MILRNGPRSLKRGRLLKPMFRGYLLHVTHDVLAQCTRACVTCHARRLGAVHTGLCYMSHTTSRSGAHGPVLHVTHDVSAQCTRACVTCHATSVPHTKGSIQPVKCAFIYKQIKLCKQPNTQQPRVGWILFTFFVQSVD